MAIKIDALTAIRYCRNSYSLPGHIHCGDGKSNCGEVCDNKPSSASYSRSCSSILGSSYTGTATCNSGCSGYDISGCEEIIPPGMLMCPPPAGSCGAEVPSGRYICRVTSNNCNTGHIAQCTGERSDDPGVSTLPVLPADCTCVPNSPCCGDGSRNQGGEQCDNGTANTDTPCTASYGSSCTYCDKSCIPYTVQGARCGDNNIDTPYENCDDGNTVNGDGCSSTCQLDLPSTCDASCWLFGSCGGGLTCNYDYYDAEGYYGLCRNSSCPEKEDCVCPPTGTPIQMKCGQCDDTGNGVSACIHPNPLPSASCADASSCVYANEITGLNPQCFGKGLTTTNKDGHNIVCSESNAWCPEGYKFDPNLGVGGKCTISFGLYCYGEGDVAVKCPDAWTNPFTPTYFHNSDCFGYSTVNGKRYRTHYCKQRYDWPLKIGELLPVHIP